MFVKERLCVVIPACFGWIQFYIFTFCLICFVDFSWFFYIWSPFWCCPAGNISRLKEFYIRRLSQNDGVAPAMARLRQSRSPRSNFGSPRTSPRQTPRCQLGCYDLHVGKKRFANMFPAMLIYVVSYCNCLSHFHSFSPLSQKCPPQQWRERERATRTCWPSAVLRIPNAWFQYWFQRCCGLQELRSGKSRIHLWEVCDWQGAAVQFTGQDG